VFVGRLHLSIERICIPGRGGGERGSFARQCLGAGGRIIFPIRYKYTGRIFPANTRKHRVCARARVQLPLPVAPPVERKTRLMRGDRPQLDLSAIFLR